MKQRNLRRRLAKEARARSRLAALQTQAPSLHPTCGSPPGHQTTADSRRFLEQRSILPGFFLSLLISDVNIQKVAKDSSLDNLLDLDGVSYVVGGPFWVKFHIKPAPVTLKSLMAWTTR